MLIIEWFLDKSTHIWQRVNALNNYFSDFDAFLIALLIRLYFHYFKDFYEKE
jgi:hypothetical protein